MTDAGSFSILPTAVVCPRLPVSFDPFGNLTSNEFRTQVLLECEPGAEFLDGGTEVLVECDHVGYWIPPPLTCSSQ